MVWPLLSAHCPLAAWMLPQEKPHLELEFSAFPDSDKTCYFLSRMATLKATTGQPHLRIKSSAWPPKGRCHHSCQDGCLETIPKTPFQSSHPALSGIIWCCPEISDATGPQRPIQTCYPVLSRDVRGHMPTTTLIQKHCPVRSRVAKNIQWHSHENPVSDRASILFWSHAAQPGRVWRAILIHRGEPHLSIIKLRRGHISEDILAVGHLSSATSQPYNLSAIQHLSSGTSEQ